MKLQSACISILILLFNVVSSSIGYSQTTLWSEDFNSYSNGTTIAPLNKWSSSCPACVSGDYFQVENGVFEGNDVNDWAIWESEWFDISSCGDVVISLDALEAGDHDGPGCACGIFIDYLDVYYSIDGAAYVLIENWNGDGDTNHTLTGDTRNGIFDNGDWLATNISKSGLTGDSMRVKIEVRNTASDEFIRFDNIVIGCNTVLSEISLSPLSGKPLASGAELSWQVITNENVVIAHILKSEDGSNFYEIATRTLNQFQGVNSSTLNFNFTDPSFLNGTNFYQVFIQSVSGQKSYTNVVELSAIQEDPEIRLYPNPSNENLYFEADSEIESLQIFDLTGRLISQQKGMKKKILINSNQWAKGIYTYRLRSAAKNYSGKIIVR